MPTDSSDATTVVAIYPARHYAEMAKDFLGDHDIVASVVADDVHVPLQLTEGARLLVLQSQADEARRALEDAGLSPQRIAAETDADGAEE
jgi:hypothetical protein